MTATNGSPSVNLDDLMKMIESEVRHRKTPSPKPMQFDSAKTDNRSAYLWSKLTKLSLDSIFVPSPLKIGKADYQLSDFMNHHGHNFILSAYAGVLGRHPDPEGYHYYLANLQQGKMTKAEIVGRLRYSPEGRRKAVKIKGLMGAFLIQSSYKIPVLGYLIRMASAMFNLPLIIKNIQSLDVYLQDRMLHTHCYINKTNLLLENKINEIIDFQSSLENLWASNPDRVDLEDLASRKVDRAELETLAEQKADRAELETMIAQKADRTELEAMTARKADRAQLEAMTARKADRAQLDTMAEQKADRAELLKKADKDEMLRLQEELKDAQRLLRDHRLNIVDQQRRIAMLLEETRKRLPEPLNNEQIQVMVAEEEHLLDAMYVSFEDQFRGTRQGIKERQKPYLLYVEEALMQTGHAPLLDLGCGRGEWLELVKEKGYPASGVDKNRVMVRQCTAIGLEVIEADIIDFLKSQESETYGAITGFHIIEHLGLKTFLSLFDESLRVLKPGGIIIFETPNPQNILVGACYFYSDPTHNHPLFPDSVRFLAELRGFVKTRIETLHKYSDYFSVEDQDSFKNKWFYCEMDYALIGYKA